MHSPERPLTQSLAVTQFQRELGSLSRGVVSRFNETFARKLSVENVLQGHEGCVNRLTWNEEGNLLASGSDDRRVLLWHYPESNLAPVVVKTQHLANVFGVRMLPCSGNRRLVTGAMDCSVQLHVLDAAPSSYARVKQEQRTVRWVPDERNEPIPSHTTSYSCHSKRVKGVEVAPQDPHMFWSVGEDGDVRQFDTRCRTSMQDEEDSPNVLLSLKRRNAADDPELKCMALNKVRPNEVAVGAHDHYIRIYDRRMLCTGPPRSARVHAKALLMLAPPHLCLGDTKQGRGRQHTTGVSFGARGDKVVASYHSDHAYSFDITRSSEDAAESALAYAAASVRRRPSSVIPASAEQEVCSTFGRGEEALPMPCLSDREEVVGLSRRAEECKSAGNHAYFEKKFALAVLLYSDAIHYAPHVPLLYSNRSAALMGRNWEGDAWYALQDAEQALRIAPSSSKAVYRRIQALRALGLLEEAAAAMDQFESDFPEMQKDAMRLRETVAGDLAERRRKAELRRTQALARRRSRTELRQRSASRRRLRTDRAAAAASNGASAAGPRPPTPVPPVNPFLEASMRAAQVGGRADSAATDSPAAAQQTANRPSARGPNGPHAEQESRPGREEVFRSAPMHGAEEARSNAPAGHNTSPSTGQHVSRGNQPISSELEERCSAVPGPPPGSPPLGPEGSQHADLAAVAQAALAEAQDVLAAGQQYENEEADMRDWSWVAPDFHIPPGNSLVPWEQTNQEWSNAMEVDLHRGEVGSGVFNLPAEAWDSDSGGLDSGEEPLSDDEMPLEDEEASEDARSRTTANANFSSRDVAEGRRLLQRYIGHCNIQTDIKEVTFLGDNDELVAAGSDDGRIFIYAARSGAPIVALEVDEDVANCVVAHPSLPVLATSGIESVVRLWSPKGPAVTLDLTQEVAANQDRMRAGPSFGTRLNPRLLAAITQNPELLQVIMSRTTVAGLSRDMEGAGADQDYEGPPGGCVIS